MWMRPKKFADLHKVSATSVRNWIRLGKVTFKKIGNSTYVWSGDGDPDQITRMEKKLDDILHEVRLTNARKVSTEGSCH